MSEIKNVPVNDNNQQVPLKRAANESLESDDYMLNEDDSYIPLTAVNDNTMDSYKSNKTGLGKKIGAFGALAGHFWLKELQRGRCSGAPVTPVMPLPTPAQVRLDRISRASHNRFFLMI